MPLTVHTRTFLPALLMVVSTLCAVGMIVCVRRVSAELHPFVIAFWRNLFGALVLFPWLIPNYRFALATRRFGTHVLRAVVSIGAMLAGFMAMALIPVAQFTALNFLTPLFATLSAILFVGEKGRLWRWAALGIGFAGMLVLVRPGISDTSIGVLFAIGSAAIWGLGLTVIRSLGRTEKAITTTLWAAILMALLSVGPAFPYWHWPAAPTFVWLIAIGLIGSLSQIALAQALIIAEAGAIMPLDFLKLIWAAGLGFMVFGEIPDVWTWVGGSIIFTSGLILLLGERALKPKPVRPPGAE